MPAVRDCDDVGRLAEHLAWAATAEVLGQCSGAFRKHERKTPVSPAAGYSRSSSAGFFRPGVSVIVAGTLPGQYIITTVLEAHTGDGCGSTALPRVARQD